MGLVADLIAILGDALAKGIAELMSGKDMDAALAASIEHIEDVRAKAKFPQFLSG